MSFQETSEGLLAKLHLTNVNKPMVLGLTLLFAAILIAGVSFLVQTGMLGDMHAETTKSSLSDTASSKANVLVTVHVTGCVMNPGVYELEDGSRTNDAIQAAGGFSEEANTETLNLARVLSDGEQICVPCISNEVDQEDSSTASTSTAVVNGVVNINKATSEELQTLSGVGPSTAEKIIADREQNGPFSSKEDLKRVSGIGDKRYVSLEPYITVG